VKRVRLPSGSGFCRKLPANLKKVQRQFMDFTRHQTSNKYQLTGMIFNKKVPLTGRKFRYG